MEVAATLKSIVRMLPVLVQGASMLHCDELPDDLVPLTRTTQASSLLIAALVTAADEHVSAVLPANAVARLPNKGDNDCLL